MLSKKYYKAFAELLAWCQYKYAPENCNGSTEAQFAIKDIKGQMMTYFKTDNHAFDSDRFLNYVARHEEKLIARQKNGEKK